MSADPQHPRRKDTKLEAEGAEFLVLGNLLIEGIHAFKAYTNFPGFDLIAVAPDTGRQCRIQVKSRWATDFDRGFLIKSFDCDFVVLAALNRGYTYRKKGRSEDSGLREPEFYVVPVAVVQAARYEKSRWGKVFLRHIENLDTYLSNWAQIREFLGTRVTPTG